MLINGEMILIILKSCPILMLSLIKGLMYLMHFPLLRCWMGSRDPCLWSARFIILRLPPRLLSCYYLRIRLGLISINFPGNWTPATGSTCTWSQWRGVLLRSNFGDAPKCVQWNMTPFVGKVIWRYAYVSKSLRNHIMLHSLRFAK